MNVDNALRELGMLSVITDSRKQFLLEKSQKQEREATKKSSSGYHVLCMNPAYVTGLGPIKYVPNEGMIKDDEPQKSPRLGPSCSRMDSQENLGKATREKRFRRHYTKPYYHLKCVKMETDDDNTFMENGNQPKLACTRSLRRRRSKSLDDIKLVEEKVQLVKEKVQQKSEVEKVAKVMQNLTVK